MDILAKRLKWLRHTKRYSQSEIAKMIGMSASGYQKIELGERDPKLDVLVKLSEIFNESADFLLGITHKIKELDQLKKQYDFIVRSRSEAENKYSTTVYDLENQYDMLSALVSTSTDLEHESIKIRQQVIDRHTEKKESLERELKYLIYDERDILTKYILLLAEIPTPDNFSDDLIDKVSPLKFELEYMESNEFTVTISANSIIVGNYGSFKSDVKAGEVALAFDRKFNSRAKLKH